MLLGVLVGKVSDRYPLLILPTSGAQLTKFSDINLSIVRLGDNRPIQQLEGWYEKIFKSLI